MTTCLYKSSLNWIVLVVSASVTKCRTLGGLVSRKGSSQSIWKSKQSVSKFLLRPHSAACRQWPTMPSHTFASVHANPCGFF